MKTKDLKNLLNRAAAGIETPDDLSEEELKELLEDLTSTANEVEKLPDVVLRNRVETSKRIMEEIDETLTSIGWRGDSGLLYRVRKQLQTLRETV